MGLGTHYELGVFRPQSHPPPCLQQRMLLRITPLGKVLLVKRHLTAIPRLSCDIRCLRRDKMTEAMQAFVVDVMGTFFVEPPTFNLKACYEDSSVTMPLIFVLSTGSDPNKARGMQRKTASYEGFMLFRSFLLESTWPNTIASSLFLFAIDFKKGIALFLVFTLTSANNNAILLPRWIHSS